MADKISIDASSLNKVMDKLKDFEKEIPQAVRQALNRTIDHVYTQTGRIVTKHYNITVREVKDSMSKRKASSGSLDAHVKLRGKRFTLGRFLPGGLGSKSKVAKVKIKKTAGYKRVGGEPKAFVQKVGGNAHVMRRESQTRYPIEVMRTIATAQMVGNLDVKHKIQESANEMLGKRIEHEIERRLKRMSR